MKIASSKTQIFLLAFLLGIGTTLGLSNWMSSRNGKSAQAFPFSINQEPATFFDRAFNEDFFGNSRDPFQEMRRMQKQMLGSMASVAPPDQFQGSFDHWYKDRFGSGSAGEIKQREDDQSVYYDIDLKGQLPKQMQIDVRNGQIDITGKVEAEKKDDGSSSFFVSSFHRSFPVPPNVDEKNYKMEQDGDKIVIKFPKMGQS